MEQIQASRRMLVAGGAVAAAALATGWWRTTGARPSDDGAVTVVRGMEAPPIAIGGNGRDITRLVGQAVRIGGEFGPAVATIATAVALPGGDVRPAGIRPFAYALTFFTDRAGAPRGDAIYDLGVAIDGMDRLFLTRGADRGNQATLTAVIG